MANFDYIFTLQSATGGTVTLTSSPFTVAQYSGSGMGRGGATVAETLEVRIMDGSSAANLAELRAVEALLEQAKDAQKNPTIAPVYLTWQETTGGTIWRSEIVNGRANLRDDAIQRGYWTNDTAFAPIVIERKNFWEGPEVQIPLTNDNDADNTSGLAVYNCNDGSGSAPTKRVNYADIDGADVGGNLPGATRLEIVNPYATNRLYNVWIGHNYTDPANYVWNYEAESATGATPTASADDSGGNYVSTTVTTTEAPMLTWSLTTTQLSAARGQFVHMLARFNDFSYLTLQSCRFRARIAWGVTTLWESEQVLPSSAISTIVRDLFTFRLPPWLAGLPSLDGINLSITGQVASGASQNVGIDFVNLLPADGFRYLQFEGYGAPQNYRIVDDGILDELYLDDGAGAGKVGIISGFGEAIKLQPGKGQRLYFLMHSNALGTAEIDRKISVKLYYRPRRASL